ncbi:hypothetical protein [Botryobacter ruber]|uniref:hypothetical protein n=1 Tax=Botryobacter ruber TaxID=2171629 RepID=UPI000E0B4531|nr:hypothetical protein [Botryobacter ruber]
MKKANFLTCLLLLFITLGCEKDPVVPQDPYQNSPGTAVHADFKGGVWFWGYSGPQSYYDADGNEVGKELEAGRQYRFSEVDGKGRMEFEQYLGMRNGSNCVTEIYTRKKGTVKFEGTNKFIFYPVEGSFKTIKKGTSASCSNETSERQATPDDLKPITILYEIRVIDGEKLLYVFGEDDQGGTDPLFVYQRTE